VPTVFQRHTRMSRGGLTREWVDPEVRGGVGLANQSGSIVSSHKSTTSSSSYPSLIAQPTTATTGHREEYPSGHPPPTTNPRQASSSPDEPLQSHLVILPTPEPRHRRALLTTDPVHRGNSLSARSSPQLRLPQGLP
jgi:hypothetical protein